LTRVRRASFGALTTLIIFGLLELGVRQFGPRPGPDYVLKGDLQWALPPNLDAQPFTIIESGRRFPVSTNAHGLRSHDHPKDSDQTWVLLGDSLIFGWGVADEETTPARLEEVLSKRHGRNIHVINGGHPGFSSFQSLQLFKSVFTKGDVDRVLIEIPSHNKNGVEEADRDRFSSPREPGWDTWLVAHWRTFRLLRNLRARTSERYEDQVSLDVHATVLPNASTTVRVPLSHLHDLLKELDATGENWGFDVVIWFNPQTYPRRGDEEMIAMIQGLGPRIHPLWLGSASFDGITQLDAAWLMDNPGHLSKFGSYLAAQRLASQLEQNGLLP